MSIQVFGAQTLEKLIALIGINILGLLCIGLIFYLTREKTPNSKTKLFLSGKIGLIMVMLLAIISGNLGIYFWIKSGNFQAVLFAIPLLFCGSPFVFVVVLAGTYIQLLYRDRFQKFINSQK
jgi:hypothetical protein